jgi:hypothetical protein
VHHRRGPKSARYGERPAGWALAGTPGTPAIRWEGDALRSGPLDPWVSYVLVRYVGWQIPNFGWSYALRVGDRVVHVILVNQERHRRYHSLVLPERRLEQQTLIHEYGHLLGLPPFDHGYFALYPDLSGGAHCVNPDCALSKPRFRALLYGLFHTVFGRHFLEDYCCACQRAIAAAKALWRSSGETTNGPVS